MMDDHDIIEAEIVGESVDEATPVDPTPKRITSDKRKQILFWGTLMRNCLRHGLSIFAFGGLGGLAFAIVYGEQKFQYQFVLMIIAFTLSVLGLLAFGFGFIARALMIHYMKQDPNYESQI